MDSKDIQARAALMAAEGIHWQAHRGGGGFERPDNTMASFLYGWSLGGVPEADIRRTKDGVIVCLHDPTLGRTTDASGALAEKAVTELAYETFAGLDAGAKFGPAYQGERVPRLVDLFAQMRNRPERGVYLDLKEIDLDELAPLIAEAGLEGRCIVAGPERDELEALKRRLPTVQTMLWCGGTAQRILGKFEAAASLGFRGLDRVQLHLNDRAEASGWRYEVEAGPLGEALAAAARAGIGLEVLPWHFAEADIHALLDLGLRGYATDEPERFCKACETWISRKRPA